MKRIALTETGRQGSVALVAIAMIAFRVLGNGGEARAAQKESPPTERRAAVGDKFRLVLSDSDNTKEVDRRDVTVSKEGRVAVPYVGQVNVAGRTAKEIRESLVKAYGPAGVNVRVSVDVQFIEAPRP